MRAFNQLVVLRPREDLDRAWNSSLIQTPDSALTSSDSLTIGDRRDATAIAEVISIGPGCGDTVSVGDIVALPLYGASKVIVLKKEVGLLVHHRGLAAVVRNVGKPGEKIEAINGYVLTRQDREAFETHMYGGLRVPDAFLSDGMPVDSGTEGIVRVLLERAVSGGVDISPGELLGFNPLAACRFRRLGQWLHLVPFEDVQFGTSDE